MTLSKIQLIRSQISKDKRDRTTTIHAGSCRQALSRLRFICQLADTSSEIPMSALNNLVSESVDVVVHCAREADGPRVTEILAVEDQTTGFDSTQFTVTDLFTRGRVDQPLAWTGQLPGRAARALEGAGYDLRDLLGVPEQSTQTVRADAPPVEPGRAYQDQLDAKLHELRSRRAPN